MDTLEWNWLHHDWKTEHGYRRDRHKPHQHWKWPQYGNGLHYAKHQSGREEASKKEYANNSWHSNYWNEEEHVSTRTEKKFTALEEHDDMDILNKNMTEMIQQSAMSITKQTKKQKKPKISSPTRALMKKT